MADRQSIYAGDTSDVWEIGLVVSAVGVEPAVLATLDGNFTCRLVVPHDTAPISRAINAKNGDNTRFLAWLTPAETLALGKGTHRIGIELRNPSLVPELVRETHRAVVINAALVPPAP